MNESILHLNVKRKWFDMIKSGEKKEEYRDLSIYWGRILVRHAIKIKNIWHEPRKIIICFSNGYSKNRNQLYIECKGLKIGIGKKKWGASGERQFILSLGNILDNL